MKNGEHREISKAADAGNEFRESRGGINQNCENSGLPQTVPRDKIAAKIPPPKFIQAAFLCLTLLVGISSMTGGMLQTIIVDNLSSVHEYLQTLPFIEGRTAALAKYKNVADVIVLSWVFSWASMVYSIAYMALALAGSKTYFATTEVDLLKIIDADFYSKAYLPAFRPSKWLIPQARNSINGNLPIQQSGDTLRLNEVMNIASRCGTLKQHLFLTAALAIGTLLLSSTGAEGVLGKSALSFYVGYPVFIFIVGTFIAELLIYSLSRLSTILK